MVNDEKITLVQFHHTISEQLNARLSESPKFFGLLIIISTGYGYVLSKPEELASLFVPASLLAYGAILWATWYLAALGYAFRFLQNTQHCIEHELGWDRYTPLPENGRRIGKPPCPPQNFSDTFWLLPGIYHAHAAGLGTFLAMTCTVFGWRAWIRWQLSWQHSLVIGITVIALLFGLVWLRQWNLHYLKRFCGRWRNPEADESARA